MIQFRLLDQHEPDATFEQIAVFFRAMYVDMDKQGITLKLSPDGEHRFVKTIRLMQQRINFVAVAEDEGTIIGFAHGNLKTAPDYLGSAKIGYITSLFIRADYRNQGLAGRLMDFLVDAIQARNVDIIEFDVLIQNTISVNIWEKRGFRKESVKFFKTR